MVDDLMEMLAIVLLPFAVIAFQILIVMLLIIVIFATVWKSLQSGED